MSQEKWIENKHDAHHEGRRSTLRRLDETDDEIVEFWATILWPEIVDYLLGDERFDPSKGNVVSIPPK